MHILLATNYQPPHMGGIEFAGQALKSCWERDAHTVTWLTTDLPPKARPSTDDNVRLPAWNGLENRWQINSPLISPLAARRIRPLLERADAVSVHSLAPGLTAWVLALALRMGKPTIVTQHVAVIPLGSRLLTLSQRRFLCALARWSVGRGALLTFVGEAVREWFLQNAGVPAERVFMTPAGIDQTVYHFVPDQERRVLRAKWQLADENLHVLFVGRFYDKKGLPLLREVAQRCPAVRFTLVGGGPLDPATWGLPNVRVLSFVSDSELRELYGAHDLFVLPSYGEGWPAVVPQAMACGLACLISQETFAGYGRDEDRFLVCPRQPDRLTELLQRAAAGQVPLLRQRRELAEYAARTWDWQRTARLYTDLFARLRSGDLRPANDLQRR